VAKLPAGTVVSGHRIFDANHEAFDVAVEV
jgi:hypothetical protein